MPRGLDRAACRLLVSRGGTGFPDITEDGQFGSRNHLDGRPFDEGAVESIVELTRGHVALHHCEMQRRSGRRGVHPPARRLEELPANALSLERGFHMEVIEQRSPPRILVEEHAGQPDDRIAGNRLQHTTTLRVGRAHAGVPELPALVNDRSVEEGVRQEAAIRAAPALRVQRGDLVGVFGVGGENREVGY